MNTFWAAAWGLGLTELQNASAFDICWPATPQPRVMCADCPGLSKGWAAHS